MKIICAYTVNLDAVYNVNAPELARLSGDLKPENQEKITRLEDLLSALLFCMKEGSGDELPIEREEVAGIIERAFHWEYRLGGNAGIMAGVLATLGAQSVLNAPAIGRRMAEMLHPEIRIPVSRILKEPLVAAGDKEMIHFVFQFTEGQTIMTSGGPIVSSKANRLIATYDPLNSRLYSSPDFDAYCQAKIKDFDGAIVSGFHLVPVLGFKEIFDRKIEQISSWKKANPGLYVHEEMGAFHEPEIMEYLLERLPVDSLGMNEDELARVTSLKPGWRGTMEAVLQIRERLGLSRVAVHTRDYIISVMKGLIPPEREVEALTRGADAAAALAATGSITGLSPTEVNPEGLDARDEFLRNGAVPHGRGAYTSLGGEAVCLVPSLLARHPKFTVGLGDTTTAAIFYEEMLARRMPPGEGHGS
ncbi:MAG: ADP-dependent glucokinase/phosphofructokinase [Methanotrichaceae archaeon]|jgi:ADP-dependent phosphofructokinase/glucokinase